MSLISEAGYKSYNVQDVVVSINGLEMRGLMNEDACIKISYNEPRYDIKETVDNNGISVMTNSKKGRIVFTTSFLTNTWKAMIAMLMSKTIGLVTVSVPGECVFTLTSAFPESVGDISIGKQVNNEEITFLGILNVLPLMEGIPAIPAL